MCTVSYLPLSTGHFILTSNRDEDPERRTSINPIEQELHGGKVIYPQDQKATGTWIAVDECDFTLCLLNGAFEKHTKLLNYRRSRGILLLDFFNFRDVKRFIEEYTFEGIEPFTLLIVRSKEHLELHKLIWDGLRLVHQVLDPNKKYIWSSVTLYDSKVRDLRDQWFKAWFHDSGKINMARILDFHKNAGKNDLENGLVMNRDSKVKTVSITSVDRNFKSIVLRHEDLLLHRISEKKMDIVQKKEHSRVL